MLFGFLQSLFSLDKIGFKGTRGVAFSDIFSNFE
jgi:hypothetical protein